MEVSETEDLMEPASQSEMRQAAERNVLTYIIALIYEQNPRQLILARGLTFAPLVAKVIQAIDPAALSNCVSVDFDNEDNTPMNANFLTILSGKLFSRIFLFHNLEPKTRLFISNFRHGMERRVQTPTCPYQHDTDQSYIQVGGV